MATQTEPESVRRYLQPNEYKVYKLIWQRFVASQMMPAIFDRTTIEIDAKSDAAAKLREVLDGQPQPARPRRPEHEPVCAFGECLIGKSGAELLVIDFPV